MGNKFTISNEMENHNRKKWSRLCTSCRNNAIQWINRIGSEIGFFTSHTQAQWFRKSNPIPLAFVSGNTLVWMFYGLYENDGSVNRVRRSKVQTKENFYEKWATDRLTNDVCLSFFLFDLPMRLGIQDAHHNNDSRTAAWSLLTECRNRVEDEAAMQKKTIIPEHFLKRRLPFVQANCKCEYEWHDNEINEHLQTFSIYFTQSAKEMTPNHGRLRSNERKKEEILPCLRRTWPPNNAIRTIPNNNTANKKQKWKLSNLINNNVKNETNTRSRKKLSFDCMR